MKKLKVAVGIKGRILFLEQFPDEEKYHCYNDYLEDIETNVDTEKPPGIYLASLDWRHSQENYGMVDSYLDIIELESLNE